MDKLYVGKIKTTTIDSETTTQERDHNCEHYHNVIYSKSALASRLAKRRRSFNGNHASTIVALATAANDKTRNKMIFCKTTTKPQEQQHIPPYPAIDKGDSLCSCRILPCFEDLWQMLYTRSLCRCSFSGQQQWFQRTSKETCDRRTNGQSMGAARTEGHSARHEADCTAPSHTTSLSLRLSLCLSVSVCDSVLLPAFNDSSSNLHRIHGVTAGPPKLKLPICRCNNKLFAFNGPAAFDARRF